LLNGLQFELWIGDAAEIRTKRVRKQKTDRQDAQLLLRLMMEDRFPRIWVPDAANRDSLTAAQLRGFGDLPTKPTSPQNAPGAFLCQTPR
jgi:hypothetical protein